MKLKNVNATNTSKYSDNSSTIAPVTVKKIPIKSSGQRPILYTKDRLEIPRVTELFKNFLVRIVTPCSYFKVSKLNLRTHLISSPGFGHFVHLYKIDNTRSGDMKNLAARISSESR